MLLIGLSSRPTLHNMLRSHSKLPFLLEFSNLRLDRLENIVPFLSFINSFVLWNHRLLVRRTRRFYMAERGASCASLTFQNVMNRLINGFSIAGNFDRIWKLRLKGDLHQKLSKFQVVSWSCELIHANWLANATGYSKKVSLRSSGHPKIRKLNSDRNGFNFLPLKDPTISPPLQHQRMSNDKPWTNFKNFPPRFQRFELEQEQLIAKIFQLQFLHFSKHFL